MIFLGGAADSIESAYHLAQVSLGSGRAYEKFQELCRLHTGQLSDLPRPKNQLAILAADSGFIESMNTEAIGVAGIQIKAGRSKTSDKIEPTAGIEFHFKVGDQVQAGQPLFTVYGADLSLLKSVSQFLLSTVRISETAVQPQPLILNTLTY